MCTVRMHSFVLTDRPALDVYLCVYVCLNAFKMDIANHKDDTESFLLDFFYSARLKKKI